LLALAGALPFLLLREFMRLFSFSHLRMVPALLADSLIAAIQISVLIVLVWRHSLSVEATFAAMGAACAIACCAWFLIERHPLNFASALAIGHWRENWSFARWGLGGQLINRGAAYATPWIVALAHGDAATGVLAACTTLVNLAGTFVAGVSNFLTPRAARAFAEGGVAELLLVLRRTATVFVIVVGTFCLAILLFGDPIARLIYGDRFSGMGAVLTVLAFGALASSLGLTAGNGLWAINRPGTNFAADVATLVVSIALLAALVGPLGVLGAALASSGGTIAGAAIRWYVLAKLLGELRRAPHSEGGSA
jgi:O-antigen/teichoic acid export membrane protein